MEEKRQTLLSWEQIFIICALKLEMMNLFISQI